MFFIASSPAVKVFLPEWHSRIQKDPSLIRSMEPFEFFVNRGTSSIKVQFNTPMQVPAKMGKDEKEILNILNWLTGGPHGFECQETDWTGIVMFDPQVDMISTFDQISQFDEDGTPAELAKARKKAEKITADAAAKVKATRAKVKLQSEERIERVLKNMYNNMHRQWQLNKQANVGNEEPSVVEKLAMFVLDDRIRASNDAKATLDKKVNEIMSTRNFA